jgi:hypothetical protein
MTDIKQILKELGAVNVENFYFDRIKGKWVVTYTNHAAKDEFETFDAAYTWLKKERQA